jgi:hypothetical protein
MSLGQYFSSKNTKFWLFIHSSLELEELFNDKNFMKILREISKSVKPTGKAKV